MNTVNFGFYETRLCRLKRSLCEEIVRFPNCQIIKAKCIVKTLICVQKLCRIEIIPDYTGVGLGRFH